MRVCACVCIYACGKKQRTVLGRLLFPQHHDLDLLHKDQKVLYNAIAGNEHEQQGTGIHNEPIPRTSSDEECHYPKKSSTISTCVFHLPIFHDLRAGGTNA